MNRSGRRDTGRAARGLLRSQKAGLEKGVVGQHQVQRKAAGACGEDAIVQFVEIGHVRFAVRGERLQRLISA